MILRARAIMVTTYESLANAVSDEVERQLKLLPRESIARPAIENNSYIAIMDNIEDMNITVMNEVAPEHLGNRQIQWITWAPFRNVGSVFLGAYASEPIRDYVGGTEPRIAY